MSKGSGLCVRPARELASVKDFKASHDWHERCMQQRVYVSLHCKSAVSGCTGGFIKAGLFKSWPHVDVCSTQS